jgi:UPF0113 PUA domain
VKPSAEMSFLYGNHVAKSGLARITDATPQYAGVVVYSMNDIPMGKLECCHDYVYIYIYNDELHSFIGYDQQVVDAVLYAVWHIWIVYPAV